MISFSPFAIAGAAALALSGCASMSDDMADGSTMASAASVPTVGGAPMYPTKTIVENAVNSADHTTLVAAVKAAGLVDTLSGPGHAPYSHRPTMPSPSFPEVRSRRC